VTDTARVLLTAAVLSATASAFFARRIGRLEAQPARLVGQLRLAQCAAVLLAAVGGIPAGLGIAESAVPNAHLDVTIGIGFVVLAALVLQREPRQALLLAAIGFLVHALLDLAHRPGWLPPDLAPRWCWIGSASYDVCMAAICYVARRR
jgi:hypothetical protein